MDLSIIVVNWNSGHYLRHCLDSVFSRSVSLSFEVFVVDNASSDDSLTGLKEQFPRVQWLENEENVGFARANNQALKQARGRYLLVLNPDTVILDDALEQMIRLMDAHPGVGIGACQLLNSDGTIQRSCRSFPTLWTLLWDAILLDALLPPNRVTGRYELRYWHHDSERDVDQPAGAFLMVRRELLASVGFMDERFFVYYEDVDWCFRAMQAGWRVVFWPAPKVLHHGGGSANSHYTHASALMHESMLKYFRKHYGVGASVLAQLISLAGAPVHLGVWAVQFALNSSKRPVYARLLRGNFAWWKRELRRGMFAQL